MEDAAAQHLTTGNTMKSLSKADNLIFIMKLNCVLKFNLIWIFRAETRKFNTYFFIFYLTIYIRFLCGFAYISYIYFGDSLQPSIS